MKNYLIIFDMDNTLLQSRIDFSAMKHFVHTLLDRYGLGQYKRTSTANTILAFCDSPDYDPALAEEMWRGVAVLENAGLEQSVLEPKAKEALAFLGEHAELAVLTNNTDYNLKENLGRLELLPHLSCVAGRDSVPRLKPAPEGMLWVASQYPQVPFRNVLAVGDALNDAQAAQAAGIPFVAYNRSRMEDWAKWDLELRLQLNNWEQASCAALLSLWGI
ncbi:MAG: HAD family hydrolase [Bacillota bacterium]|nr:HAD family hydrolase [Bacillota bacterium]